MERIVPILFPSIFGSDSVEIYGFRYRSDCFRSAGVNSDTHALYSHVASRVFFYFTHLVQDVWANLQASLPLDMRAPVGPLLFLSFSHIRGVCRNFFSHYQVHFNFSRGWKYGSISGISYHSLPGTRFASMVFE